MKRRLKYDVHGIAVIKANRFAQTVTALLADQLLLTSISGTHGVLVTPLVGACFIYMQHLSLAQQDLPPHECTMAPMMCDVHVLEHIAESALHVLRVCIYIYIILYNAQLSICISVNSLLIGVPKAFPHNGYEAMQNFDASKLPMEAAST